jgi:acetyltransferase-like isoleucine patch superfamily enzyme
MEQRRFARVWCRFWMHFAGRGPVGRVATRLASWFALPHRFRHHLADLSPRGYISPRATIYHDDLQLGKHVFIGDGAVILQAKGGGRVEIGDETRIFQDTVVETGFGGSVSIGPDTYIMPFCQLMGYAAPIRIGANVQMAQNCAVYPYNHGIAEGELIIKQPLTSRGAVTIEDDAWLGTGVIVLSGVTIGAGAVVGAGSVVTRDIPPGAIAAGSPARVIGARK